MEFDPNNFALHNKNFIGLPFEERNADLVLVPVPWDLTTSFRPGTSKAPRDILEISYQLDLFDRDFPNHWERGIWFAPVDLSIQQLNDTWRPQAKAHIDFLESGKQLDQHAEALDRLQAINEASVQLNEWVYQQTKTYLKAGKRVGLIGGDHSTPLGYYQALAEIHGSFSILQIDAHCDLRPAYEGFTYSHASIMHQALQLDSIQRLHQIGIRDLSHAEFEIAQQHPKVHFHGMSDLRNGLLQGDSFDTLLDPILGSMEGPVYISFDIDGLDPVYCPATGTPVPGGLSYAQADYLIRKVARNDFPIIGFDFVETGAHSIPDANTAARLIYLLSLVCLDTI
ncbi:MAG: agmatinase family protein [Bacteroidota bacterium]